MKNPKIKINRTLYLTIPADHPGHDKLVGDLLTPTELEKIDRKTGEKTEIVDLDWLRERLEVGLKITPDMVGEKR